VRHELTSGAFELPDFEIGAVRAASSVITRYYEQHIGDAHASLVVLAERYATRSVLTPDRRRFGALRTTGGDPFEILP